MIIDPFVGIVDYLLGFTLRWLGRRLGVVRLGPFVVDFKGAARTTYDETLQKISAAQAHLSQAVESIDSIRTEFTAEKSRLDALLEEIKARRQEYEQAAADLETARDLLGKDKNRLRSALGLDERRGRLSGFVAGVLASLMASFLWAKGPELWKVLVALWGKTVQ
jgi:hypothetical protein